MTITKENIGKKPLDDFVAAVAGIYNEQDESRSLYDIWLHATHHAASIGEEVRKFKLGEKLFIEIADFAMWLFTFLGKVNKPLGEASNPHGIEESAIRVNDNKKLSDIIWQKYPELCPACFWRLLSSGTKIEEMSSILCECLLYEIESRDQTQLKDHLTNLQKYAEMHIKEKPESVDQWQQMFYGLFEANLRHIDLVDIAFHLLEEVGEVSNAIVHCYTYVGEEFKSGEPRWRRTLLESEIADVCSWMFTLVNYLKLIPEIGAEFQKYAIGQEIIRPEPLELSGMIWKRYGDVSRNNLYCPHKCLRPVCRCPIILINDKQKLSRVKV